MPTYDYECSNCGRRFELFQKMSDPPCETCPDCGGPVRRLIGAGAGLLFKGSGFYITDYRSPEYKTKAAGDSGSTPAAAKSEGVSGPPSKPKAPETSGDGGASKKKPESGK